MKLNRENQVSFSLSQNNGLMSSISDVSIDRVMDSLCCVLTKCPFPTCTLQSFFGRAFEKAAESTSSRTLHDHFDTSSKIDLSSSNAALQTLRPSLRQTLGGGLLFISSAASVLEALSFCFVISCLNRFFVCCRRM